MGKLVSRKIPIELDERLTALREELLRAGIPLTKIAVGRMVALKIPDININVEVFKTKRRDKRIRFV